MNDYYPDGCSSPCNPYREECERINCPICGEELIHDDELFKRAGDRKIIGCSHCVFTEAAYD